MPRWVDLSAHGLALKVGKQDDRQWLVLETQAGSGRVPDDAATRLGFVLRDGVYQREGTKITLSEVQREFPGATVGEFDKQVLVATPVPPPPPAPGAGNQSRPDAPGSLFVPAPAITVPAGRWRECLDAIGVRGSVPINKVPWIKISRDRWTDGERFLDTARLAAQAERLTSVIEGETRPLPAVPAAEVPVDEAVIAAAAALSPAAFLQAAKAHHDGQRWQVLIDDRPVFMPPDVGAQSARKRPETILAEVHEAQVRHIVERNPYACTSLPALAAYPALAYPGPLARGRRAELNVMRLLGTLGIAERLLAGDDGYCKLHNDPYMDLVIERHDEGERDALYLTHYFDQGGDRVLDAEMVFAIDHGRLWFKETATISVGHGQLRGPDRTFANIFSQNLLRQGFDRATVEWPHDPDPRPAPSLRMTPTP